MNSVNREWSKGPRVVFGKDSSMGSMAYSDPFTEETLVLGVTKNVCNMWTYIYSTINYTEGYVQMEVDA